ncbi:MAG: large conductance mechanosensitive channel protein MscL [Deltaproteobacteria bacterium]|nr:large conductance mechanosensitive channel protein MscL [Deltaproteobacteria bacterium]
MFKEFKEFAIKGNVIDMAVGIIIGAAFTTVVKSLVDDIIMPPLSLLTGKFDVASKFLVLSDGASNGPYNTLDEAKTGGAIVWAYGNFLNTLVVLMLVSLVLFFIVRWINRLRRPDTPAAPGTKPCPYCKSSIEIAAVRCPYCTSQLESTK